MSGGRPEPAFARALVTGATGYIGARLARRLVETGVATAALVRESSALDLLGPDARQLDVLRSDGTGPAIARAVAAAKPQIVFHLAATYIARHAREDIARLVTDNVLLTAEVCEAAAEAGTDGLVHAGTAWQHAASPPHDPAPTPNTLYAATKQAADDVIGYYARTGAFAALTLEIYDTYGPGDPRGKFLDALAHHHEAGTRMAASPGEQIVHMVHVDDVVDAFVIAGNLLAADAVAGHLGFTLPSGEPTTLRGLAEAWSRATGHPAPVDWGARPYRAGEAMVPWAGTPLPGWTPRVGLAEGLRAVFG